MTTLFVTGSGTDIGKTFVCCRLLASLPGKHRIRCIKPVVTGFDTAQGEQSDPGRLLAAQGLPLDHASLEATSPWRFRAAISADMAAAREGRTIAFDELIAFCRPPATIELNLIEGLGGAMSPLGEQFTNLDLIEALEARVLLVVGSYLGALSHALTAIEAIRSRKLGIAAVVVSQSADEPVATEETAQALRRFIDEVPLVVLPRDKNASAAEIAALAMEWIEVS